MKAIILNSGMGTRLGKLTENSPKSLIDIGNNETIFSKAIKTLVNYDINDFIITTGYLDEVLREYASKTFPEVNFTFVHNPVYDSTNYIKSIDYVNDNFEEDILLLHGDLVFDKEVVEKILENNESCMVVNSQEKIPEKDFKAKVIDGYVQKVSVDYFGSDAIACQPLYKLKSIDWKEWKKRIRNFCNDNNTNVYAEEALNELLTNTIKIKAIDVNGYYCSEIDTIEDLNKYKKIGE